MNDFFRSLLNQIFKGNTSGIAPGWLLKIQGGLRTLFVDPKTIPLFFAQTIILINAMSPFFSKFLPSGFFTLLVMTLAFMLLRQFGQGIMAMVSRNVLAKWFDENRGLVTGISGIFVSFGFSAAPLGLNFLMNWLGFFDTII